MSTRTKFGEPSSYQPPAWCPGRFCPRCTSTRHQSWHTVARCRWRDKLLWVAGGAWQGGECWATVSRCRHPGCRESFVTIILHRQHELMAMHESNEVHFDDE